MGLKNKAKKLVKFLNSKEKIAIPDYVDSDKLLANKNVLITGGSGGIGYAVTKKFLQSGAYVVITGTSEDKLIRKTEGLKSKNLSYAVLNLNDIQSFDSKLEIILNEFPDHRIDILVNCAGVNPKKSFFNIDESDYDSTMNINVKGTFFFSQTVSKYMIAHKIKGHILNVSSSSALRPAWTPYEMSKWTIRGFTKGLADTLIPYGIIVNAIAPGPTATPMLNMKENDDIDLPGNPIGRYAEPEEIANLALVLASDLGNLIVGDTVYATGGSGVISLHH